MAPDEKQKSWHPTNKPHARNLTVFLGVERTGVPGSGTVSAQGKVARHDEIAQMMPG